MEVPQLSLERTVLSLNGYEVLVQIADNDESRAIGLMLRKDLPENEGMLFVWHHDVDGSFHMANCEIPLDMIFCDADGSVVDIIYNAQPEPDVNTAQQFANAKKYQPKYPYRFVIEVNGGFAVRHRVKVGSQI